MPSIRSCYIMVLKRRHLVMSESSNTWYILLLLARQVIIRVERFIMSESEAHKLAIQYFEMHGPTEFVYNTMYKIEDKELRRLNSLFRFEDGFPLGIRRKVWSFYFTPPNYEPDTVVSGGDYVIFVDDETGFCGHTTTM